MVCFLDLFLVVSVVELSNVKVAFGLRVIL